jgi:hypothetical protein
VANGINLTPAAFHGDWTYVITRIPQANNAIFERGLNASRPARPSLSVAESFVERPIGSIRRECLDRVMVLGECHLLRILTSYFPLLQPLADASGSG